MAHVYANNEFVNMLLMYGECHQVASEAARRYAKRFPNRVLQPLKINTTTLKTPCISLKIVCFLVTLYLPLKVVMVRYRSCSVMRCEDKFSSRHRFSDAANNLNLFQKWVLMKALINIPAEQIFHKPSSTLTTGNVGVNIVKVIQ
ncbi:hypothetical protein NQ317_019263 [Molorchus minor]|uniref:DUF4817 domain-containing protein n=1 Tax=Molorchus minor TaxID=1323400 RepID=A0ABQ9JVY8_9CUCU|nr:hypothetical protein NQ317_019263 [Molorchus minor]